MPDETAPKGSGADLARQALAVAIAAAKNSPTPAAKKPRTRVKRVPRGSGRDPLAFGALLDKVSAEQGWPKALEGGSILGRWPQLCPQFADTVQPVGYDPERGVLELRPLTHTIAAGLRIMGGQLAKQINDKLGTPTVRSIRVLAVGAPARSIQESAAEPVTAEPQAPIRTRETASPGYRAALEAALANRPERQSANPYVAEAETRQVAALRAGRQPEDEHRDAEWATDTTSPAAGSMEASERAARAYARQQAAGQTPRRAFDVA